MFSVGTDPELFLVNKAGVLKSSIGKIGGTKANPKETAHGWVQEDNVAVEFNIKPAFSEDEFVNNCKLVLGDISEIIKPLDLKLDIRASGIFDPLELQHPKALEAGCEPDYDAWELIINEKPNLFGSLLRSCGGHLHVAFESANLHPLNRPKLVRILDLLAGVPSILHDSDVGRRSLYGKAGAHRPKVVARGDAYDGVEYRTLSNFWLQSEDKMRWAYRAVSRAVTEFDKWIEIAEANKDIIISTINNSDSTSAKSLVSSFNLEV